MNNKKSCPHCGKPKINGIITTGSQQQLLPSELPALDRHHDKLAPKFDRKLPIIGPDDLPQEMKPEAKLEIKQPEDGPIVITRNTIFIIIFLCFLLGLLFYRKIDEQ